MTQRGTYVVTFLHIFPVRFHENITSVVGRHCIPVEVISARSFSSRVDCAVNYSRLQGKY